MAGRLEGLLPHLVLLQQHCARGHFGVTRYEGSTFCAYIPVLKNVPFLSLVNLESFLLLGFFLLDVPGIATCDTKMLIRNWA